MATDSYPTPWNARAELNDLLVSAGKPSSGTSVRRTHGEFDLSGPAVAEVGGASPPAFTELAPPNPTGMLGLERLEDHIQDDQAE